MTKKPIIRLITLLMFGVFLTLNSCLNDTKAAENVTADPEDIEVEVPRDENIPYPSEVIPFFDNWKLVLGNGENVGIANKFEHKDFFYTIKDGNEDWVVYKAPNGGGTHGTSKNIRTELAQTKKWSPLTETQLTATLKVMNVSVSGNDNRTSAHAVVVGQIHSADGHENEPLKIFYKKFPGHTKGSVYWNYEINTAGDDNSGRWDFSTPVWGNVSGTIRAENNYPEEPIDGIALGEVFSYEVDVNEGVMTLIFTSKGHETKTFTKNLIASEYTTVADIPNGKKGIERENAYAEEFLFFKQGSYNQTNGISNGGETFGGDITKQYETGNYAEVWFKEATITVPESDSVISNEGYFIKND